MDNRSSWVIRSQEVGCVQTPNPCEVKKWIYPCFSTPSNSGEPSLEGLDWFLFALIGVRDQEWPGLVFGTFLSVNTFEGFHDSVANN